MSAKLKATDLGTNRSQHITAVWSNGAVLRMKICAKLNDSNPNQL